MTHYGDIDWRTMHGYVPDATPGRSEPLEAVGVMSSIARTAKSGIYSEPIGRRLKFRHAKNAESQFLSMKMGHKNPS
jgi:hypothetical protein